MKRTITMLLLLLLLAACTGALAQQEMPDKHEEIMQWSETYKDELEALRLEQAQLEAERGAQRYLWTVEEEYAFYDKYRASQEAAPGYVCSPGLPGGEDLPLYDAIILGRDAVTDKYGEHALHVFDVSDIGVSFQVYPDGKRLWNISFYIGPEGARMRTFYTVTDAVSGELLDVYDIDDLPG